VLVECVTLFWSPAKEASVPNLVPKNKLENANQMSLFAAYGSAPVAAIIFSILSVSATAVGATIGLENYTAVDLALYLNAFSFIFSAITISQIQIPQEHIK